MSEELKPCPFDGAAAEAKLGNWARCSMDGDECPLATNWMTFDMWNRRASSASRDKVVEGLADKIDMIRDFECCDVSSKFCGWKESITEVVSAFDAALARLTPGKEDRK